jgi:RHH-type proline utilization regulon transcriptional repressor/proline dehydrogenase/delta 1-pyrroline-5-carboxylate dehydrogenase
VAARALLEWASERLPAAAVTRLRGRILDYHGWIERYFSRPQPSVPAVLGQDNTLLYRPVGPLLLAANEASAALDVVSALAAAVLSGGEVHLSVDPGGAGGLPALEWVVLGQAARIPVIVEPASELAVRLERGATYLRLRWLLPRDQPPPDAVARAAAAGGCFVSTRPVLGAGRYELLFYHREQAISADYHRYGHLGFRSEGLGEVGDAALNPRV